MSISFLFHVLLIHRQQLWHFCHLLVHVFPILRVKFTRVYIWYLWNFIRCFAFLFLLVLGRLSYYVFNSFQPDYLWRAGWLIWLLFCEAIIFLKWFFLIPFDFDLITSIHFYFGFLRRWLPLAHIANPLSLKSACCIFDINELHQLWMFIKHAVNIFRPICLSELL